MTPNNRIEPTPITPLPKFTPDSGAVHARRCAEIRMPCLCAPSALCGSFSGSGLKSA